MQATYNSTIDRASSISPLNPDETTSLASVGKGRHRLASDLAARARPAITVADFAAGTVVALKVSMRRTGTHRRDGATYFADYFCWTHTSCRFFRNGLLGRSNLDDPRGRRTVTAVRMEHGRYR